MKVLILAPLNTDIVDDYIKGKKDKDLQYLDEAWLEYKKDHPECSLGLEFEYRFGSNRSVFDNSYYYFSSQDINNIEIEINSLIESKEIAALIIDPILTKDEEKQYINRKISGETMERLFEKFNNSLLVFFYHIGSLGLFYQSPLYAKMKDAFEKRGYDLDPSFDFAMFDYVSKSFFYPMFDCIVDSCLKIEDTKEKSGKNPTLEKIVDKR